MSQEQRGLTDRLRAAEELIHDAKTSNLGLRDGIELARASASIMYLLAHLGELVEKIHGTVPELVTQSQGQKYLETQPVLLELASAINSSASIAQRLHLSVQMSPSTTSRFQDFDEHRDDGDWVEVDPEGNPV